MPAISEARKLYEEHGRRMIREQFPEYEGRIAVGLAGHGSECFGFDDEVSRDHDLDNGFCLWISDEDYRRIGAALQGEYLRLPLSSPAASSASGERYRGAMRISDFYGRYTGSPGAPQSLRQWLYLPSYALAEACNGEVWRDDAGVFTSIREQIRTGMPRDVFLKKLAAAAATMAQSGQYNYGRCLAHGEPGAAALALGEFVRACAEAVFLLNGRHMPYYKWIFRAMDGLEVMGDLRYPLEFLLTGPGEEDDISLKKGIIEDVSGQLIAQLKKRDLTSGNWDYLEPHAYEIMKRIEDPELRGMHVMEE